jgi:hypothetical protein
VEKDSLNGIGWVRPEAAVDELATKRPEIIFSENKMKKYLAACTHIFNGDASNFFACR